MNPNLKKKLLGQFNTTNDFWLHKHILSFIRSTKAEIAYDPFAGDGDLLRVAKQIGFKRIKGYDIDPSLGWTINDSLLSVPKISNSIIITNPPYLTNYSAKRRGIYNNVEKYFKSCTYDDIYQLAMEKCLSNDHGVMIVPETFINSDFPKHRLHSITIIEDNPFMDTENPICVVCFDKKIKPYEDVLVYRNNIRLGTLGYFEGLRMRPHNSIHIKFNSPSGKIALRAVDTTNPKNKISFMTPKDIDYDPLRIKHSSRLITYVDVDVKGHALNKMIQYSNELLESFRDRCQDVLLSPFKGNMKDGRRRRRLDYMTARAILERAYEGISPNMRLFNNAAN
jgi:hypothetical protein